VPASTNRPSSSDLEFRRDWLVSAFYSMARIRAFEMAVKRLFAEGRIPGFVHLSVGQEAVAVGACRSLLPEDWITSTHRGHGHCIAKGMPLKSMMAELFGKATGACKGQGGSMHIADPTLGILGANGIVGAGLPIATGAALAEQMRGEGRIAMAFFGDGAAATGAFHEAMNLAATWSLPVVFVCENNGYAEFTRFQDTSPVGSVMQRATAYAMPAVRVDGNDVEAVFEACSTGSEAARRGEGPWLIEACTSRRLGHYEGDPMKYVGLDEREEAAKQDPLELSAARLRGWGVDPTQIASMLRRATVETDQAVSFAEASPEPVPSGSWETQDARIPAQPPPDLPAASNPVRYMDAIAEAISEEMDRDENVFVLGIDVYSGGGVYGVTRPLARFGRARIRDAPISETALVGAGIGAALAGYRPIVEIMFMDFLAVCFDQLINQAAKLRFMTGGACTLPLVIRTQMGGGRSAGPQHSQSLEALFAHIPGLRVVMPSTPRDAKGLLKEAIRLDDPVLFVENRLLYGLKGDVGPQGEMVEIGQAKTVRSGTDVTAVTWSRMVLETLRAADMLEAKGISVEVIDMRTIQPLDMPTVLASLSRTKKLLVIHEAVADFGVGAEIAARAQETGFADLDAPVMRLGSAASPVPFAPILERHHLPSAQSIADRLLELVNF
jgi:2-oxoisovalerate dehydrogenase E1 component